MSPIDNIQLFVPRNATITPPHSTMETPGKQPKSMSSRLAGMKFMQRGAAASPPASPMEHAAKKQRLSSGFVNTTPAPSPRTDNDMLEQAAASQERKRAEAVAREGAMKGETKWYLSVQTPQRPAVESPLRIVSAGYSTLDATDRKPEPDSEEDDDEESSPRRPHMPGRISFGKFGRTEKKIANDADISSEDEDDDDPDDDDAGEDLSGVDSLIAQGRKEATARLRAERKEEKRAAQAEANRLAEKRRAKELDLNRPSSISNGGGKNPKANMVCYTCGEKGHPKAECPQKRAQRPSKLRQSY